MEERERERERIIVLSTVPSRISQQSSFFNTSCLHRTASPVLEAGQLSVS